MSTFVILGDIVKPRLVLVCCVIKHDNNSSAFIAFIENSIFRIARMLVHGSRRTKCSLFRIYAYIAFVIVISQVIIPHGNRSVSKEVIRQVIVTRVDRAALLGSTESYCLSLTITCELYRTRLCYKRELSC